MWVTLREVTGEEKSEARVSDLCNLVVVGIFVLIRKQGKKRMLGERMKLLLFVIWAPGGEIGKV